MNFNSQPHKEADHIVLLCRLALINFNSQPHKEADETFYNNSEIINISTHSLTRRLTVSQHTRCFRIRTFQLTASQGG